MGLRCALGALHALLCLILTCSQCKRYHEQVWVFCVDLMLPVHSGTITLLIIKHDEQTGNYRDKTGILKDYSHLNKLPRVSPVSAELHTCTLTYIHTL